MAELKLALAVRIDCGRWEPAARVDMRRGGQLRLLEGGPHEAHMLMQTPRFYAHLALLEPERVVCTTATAVVAAAFLTRFRGQWLREQQIVPPLGRSLPCYVTVPLGVRAPRIHFDHPVVRSARVSTVHACTVPGCGALSQASTVCAAHAWSLGIYE